MELILSLKIANILELDTYFASIIFHFINNAFKIVANYTNQQRYRIVALCDPFTSLIKLQQ